MTGSAWLLLVAAWGVDAGWQAGPDGKLEYIIQIPTEQYRTLAERPEGVVSNIPRELLPHLRSVRIVVRDGEVPRDPLPAGLGVVNPEMKFGDRMNAQAVGMQAGGETNPPFGTAGPESSVGPITGQPDALPGPGFDPGYDSRTLPEIPNMRGAAPAFSDVDIQPTRDPPLGATIPYGKRTRETEGYRPQTTPPGYSAPGTYNDSFAPVTNGSGRGGYYADQTASFNANSSAPQIRYDGVGPNSRSAPGYNGSMPSTQFSPPQLTPASYAMIVIGLCLSIGANMYLGWLAWEYYLRYRESFETWRNSSR